MNVLTELALSVEKDGAEETTVELFERLGARRLRFAGKLRTGVSSRRKKILQTLRRFKAGMSHRQIDMATGKPAHRNSKNRFWWPLPK